MSGINRVFSTDKLLRQGEAASATSSQCLVFLLSVTVSSPVESGALLTEEEQ